MLVADVSIKMLVTKLSKQYLWQVAQSHYLMHISQHKSKDVIVNELLQHKWCNQCDEYVCIFSPSTKHKMPVTRSLEYRNRQKAEAKISDAFPPPPASSDLIEDIVWGFWLLTHVFVANKSDKGADLDGLFWQLMRVCIVTSVLNQSVIHTCVRHNQ